MTTSSCANGTSTQLRPNASMRAPPVFTFDSAISISWLRVKGAALVGPADFDFELAGDLEQQVLLAVGGDQLDTDRQPGTRAGERKRDRRLTRWC